MSLSDPLLFYIVLVTGFGCVITVLMNTQKQLEAIAGLLQDIRDKV